MIKYTQQKYKCYQVLLIQHYILSTLFIPRTIPIELCFVSFPCRNALINSKLFGVFFLRAKAQSQSLDLLPDNGQVTKQTLPHKSNIQAALCLKSLRLRDEFKPQSGDKYRL